MTTPKCEHGHDDWAAVVAPSGAVFHYCRPSNSSQKYMLFAGAPNSGGTGSSFYDSRRAEIRERADTVITVSEVVAPQTAAIITELCGDRLALLVEVDRLRADNHHAATIRDTYTWEAAANNTRARILAAVEALRVSPTARDENPWQIGFRQSRNETVSAVLDIIENDQSTATSDQVSHEATE